MQTRHPTSCRAIGHNICRECLVQIRGAHPQSAKINIIRRVKPARFRSAEKNMRQCRKKCGLVVDATPVSDNIAIRRQRKLLPPDTAHPPPGPLGLAARTFTILLLLPDVLVRAAFFSRTGRHASSVWETITSKIDRSLPHDCHSARAPSVSEGASAQLVGAFGHGTDHSGA